MRVAVSLKRVNKLGKNLTSFNCASRKNHLQKYLEKKTSIFPLQLNLQIPSTLKQHHTSAQERGEA